MNEELPETPAEHSRVDRLGKFLGGTVLACFGTGGLMHATGMWISGRPSIYASSEVEAAAQASGLEWSTAGSYVVAAGVALLGVWALTELVVDKLRGRSLPDASEQLHSLRGAVDES